jgi:hypothetical protein
MREKPHRSLEFFSIVAAAVLASCSGDSLSPEITADDLSAVRIADDVTLGSVKVYCFNATSCVAAAFRFSPLPDDPRFGRQTQFSVFLQNLQGTYPANGPGTELRVRFFRFQFFDMIEDFDFVDADPIGTFSSIGDVQAGINLGWGNEAPQGGRNSDTFVADFGSGIVGCVNQNPPLWFTYQTCASSGLDGWVRVDFVLRHFAAEPSNEPVRFHDFEFSFGDHFAGLFCRVGGEQAETCTVLPYSHVLQALRSR